MDYIVPVAVASTVVILAAIISALWSRHERTRNNLVYRAVHEQGPKALPLDILDRVNRNKGVNMSQGELIRRLCQLVEDKLVLRNELSNYDRVRLLRKSLKGACSPVSGLPLDPSQIMARYSVALECVQHAA